MSNIIANVSWIENNFYVNINLSFVGLCISFCYEISFTCAVADRTEDVALKMLELRHNHKGTHWTSAFEAIFD